MSIDIYNDAFKSLSILNENLFDTSTLGVTKLHSFIDDDFEEDDISIIDPEASTEEELSDSYVGKIIVDCNVCHSHIFKDREDIDIDESGLVNGEDVCPYCGEQEGFVIIGQIEEFKDGEDDEELSDDSVTDTEDNEIPAAETSEEDTNDEDKEKNESIKSMHKGSSLKESLDVDSAADIVGGYDRVRQIVMETLDNYPMSEPDASEIADLSYGRVEGDGIEFEAWESLIDYVLDDVINESCKTTPKDTLNEDSGDDLASKVLAYLDRLEASGELTESMNNVKVETDENTVTVNSDENGKVTVTTEPANNASEESGEMIAPISDEEQDALVNAELPAEEIQADVDTPTEEGEPAPEDETSGDETSEDEIDVDMEEIDEESVDNLGESYLRRVYENVNSYKTTNSYIRGERIIVEGVIKFNSGKQSKTGFILEAKSADRAGRVSFTGYNKHLTNDKSAYLFEGKIKDKRLILEKLSYRYTMNESLVRGRVYNK